MSTINIPGFTAETALYRSGNSYRSHLSSSQSINGVTPQWCCQDARDCEDCMQSCLLSGDYTEECQQECHCECYGRLCP